MPHAIRWTLVCSAGWNLLSIPVLPPLPNATFSRVLGDEPWADGDYAKTRTSFMRFYRGWGWVGGLARQSFHPSVAFMARCKKSLRTEVEGTAISAYSYPVQLQAAGYQYLAYPLRYRLFLDDLEVGVSRRIGESGLVHGDAVWALHGADYATFNASSQAWEGGLVLVPGYGYMTHFQRPVSVDFFERGCQPCQTQ